MLNEITKVNFDTIREAAQDGENITIIINGQFYDLDTEAPAGTDPFIEGMKFAAALIEDNRARRQMSFEWIEGRNPKTTKRAIACNEARHNEARYLMQFIRHIIAAPDALKNALTEYKNNKFWKI